MAQGGVQEPVVVIGAGIIGVSAALALRSRGLDVLLLDRKGVAAETSSGNAGAFAFPDIEPLATPGIMRRAPRWLLDPVGPLSIPPSYALRIAPWLWRFWRASRPSRYAELLAAQAAMMRFARQATERQIAQVDGEALIQRDGQLVLYAGEREFRASLPQWDAKRDHGVAFHLLDGPDAIAEMQPGISPSFTHAGFTPEWMNVVDPAVWTRHLAARFMARGGRMRTAEAKAMGLGPSRVEIQTDEGPIWASQVVLAAGAWSHHLTRTLGDDPPLETERGYNTTLPPGAFPLRTQLTFPNHAFIVSRILGGVRVGGAVELGGLTAPPNYQRAQTMLDKAARFLPGLKTEGGSQWMGYRPSLPDSLPVIGPSSRSNRVIYAFGHGHLGLTQSAGTAELVASLIEGGAPAIDIAPFRADRF